MASADTPNATSKSGSRATDISSYCPQAVEKLGKLARELLEDYSRIPPEEVESHVNKIV